MTLDTLRTFCKSLPGATEDIKWGNDLCFCVGKKMFCVTSLTGPFSASLKVTDEEFGELTATTGIEPAPYVAKYKWILITDAKRFSDKEWKACVRRSYDMIAAKLPKRVRDGLSA